MEKGTARIGGGLGEIDPEAGPPPVEFDPHTFSHITDGQRVRFTRSQSQPNWAVMVAPAEQINRLVFLASPPNGLTPDAKALVRRTAARLCAEAQFAPSPALGQAHFNHAVVVMSAVGAELSERQAADAADVDDVAPLLP